MNVGALKGTRVLDLTRLIPGPFCTSLLAELGAEVLKVEEPTGGDYERQTKPLLDGMGYRFRMLNRNKKSVALNLKRDEGREAFLRLARRADVVVEGFRPGVMDKLGLGYEELKAANPGIICCSLSSYGHRGPKREQVAHDVNILADIGLLDLMGSEDGPPAIPGIQLADTVTSLYAAFGILASLLERAKTGEGRYLDVSMQDCAFSLMFDALRYYLADGRVPERSRERLTGGLANYALYVTRDERYLAVGSLEKKFKDELLHLVGLGEYVKVGGGVTSSEVDQAKETELKAKLADIFRQKTQAEWMEVLGPANICVSAVKTVADAASDEHLRVRGMLVECPVGNGQTFTAIGSPIPMADGVLGGEQPAPHLGAHTREVLLDAGYSEEEVLELERGGVAALGG